MLQIMNGEVGGRGGGQKFGGEMHTTTIYGHLLKKKKVKAVTNKA